MLRCAAFPSRHVQGPGALGRFGVEAARFADRVLVVADAALPAETIGRLDATGVAMHLEQVPPECTEAAIARAAHAASSIGATAIAGLGGGKTLDLARAAADECRIPFLSVPTAASSDAPCSALAVIYDDAGRVVQDRFVRVSPALVLVDSQVIVEAPARLFAAGIGDALATWFEARSCQRSGAPNLVGGAQTLLAMQIAETCFRTLLDYAPEALSDVRVNWVSEAVERVIEANILLSGVGFESGGVATAHAIHHGLSDMPETHAALHGEKVAFGILVGLMLEDAPADLVGDVLRLLRATGLPTHLSDLGITAPSIAAPIVARRACRAGEIIHNEPLSVTEARVMAAILQADRLDRAANDYPTQEPA